MKIPTGGEVFNKEGTMGRVRGIGKGILMVGGGFFMVVGGILEG